MIVYTAKRTHRRACRKQPLADARPLYIASGADTRIVLDGPALRVQREARAEQLFPLQRVSRIHSCDAAQWSSEALLACAVRGIGVLFVDERGEIVARLLGRPGLYDSLYRRLEEFMLLPQAMGMYRHWQRTFVQRAAWWTGVKLRVPETDREPALCRRAIDALAQGYVCRREEERTRQWLRTAAFGWMQSHLQDLGFGTGNELTQSGEPALARDLTEIYIWYLEPARLGWLQRRRMAARRKTEPVRAPSHAALVRLFESRATRSAARGREITGTLHRWLIHET